MGVHLRATCEQFEGKKKEKQGTNQKSKDFNMQQSSTNKKIYGILQIIFDFKNPDLPCGRPMEPRYYMTFGDYLNLVSVDS